MQIHVVQVQQYTLWALFTVAHRALTGQYSIVCYRLILATGPLWPGDQHRIFDEGVDTF